METHAPVLDEKAAARQEAARLLSELQSSYERRQLYTWCESVPENSCDPFYPHLYQWQADFLNAGRNHRFRCLMCANRVGKSMSASAEVAMHLTGWYPDWWEGKRYDKPTSWWVGSETNEASRDIVQKALLGRVGEWGTGWIPGDAIHTDGPSMRQCGISGVVDHVRVRHISGGWSYIQFKTYEQERSKWQGTALDGGIWFDEEPPPDIYTEGITRTADCGGLTILTFTPLKGHGEVVRRYMEGKSSDGVYLKGATWDDAYHLDEQSKRELSRSYPEHERDTRTKGIPMMGIGAIYPVADEKIVCDPFPIPDYYRRICGIDFGINHPFAGAWVAHDADRDVVYLYDEYQVSDQTPMQHAPAVNARGKWIPVSWPHDGGNREKGSGQTLAEQYLEQEVNLIGQSARYDDTRGGGQPTEPVIIDTLERMRTGRFKVFSTCGQWFAQKRLYHRDDRGRVVRERDDLIAACHYAMMMLRFAVAERSSKHANRESSAGVDKYDPLSAYRGDRHAELPDNRFSSLDAKW